jgi:hypothetical protein
MRLSLKSVTLQHIETVDFRKNERTCWRDFLAKNKGFKLRAGGALLLISKSMNQLCFVYGSHHIDEPQATDVIASLKLRISGGAWNPYRLSDYASEVGLELIGIKSFAEHYERSLRERAARLAS